MPSEPTENISRVTRQFKLYEINHVYFDQTDQKKLFELSDNSGDTTSSYAEFTVLLIHLWVSLHHVASMSLWYTLSLFSLPLPSFSFSVLYSLFLYFPLFSLFSFHFFFYSFFFLLFYHYFLFFFFSPLMSSLFLPLSFLLSFFSLFSSFFIFFFRLSFFFSFHFFSPSFCFLPSFFFSSLFLFSFLSSFCGHSSLSLFLLFPTIFSRYQLSSRQRMRKENVFGPGGISSSLCHGRRKMFWHWERQVSDDYGFKDWESRPEPCISIVRTVLDNISNHEQRLCTWFLMGARTQVT